MSEQTAECKVLWSAVAGVVRLEENALGICLDMDTGVYGLRSTRRLSREEAEALYRALGQHLGVEPLPGWRVTRYVRDDDSRFLSSPAVGIWYVDSAPGVNIPEPWTPFPTALDAMKAVEALAGKEKPE